MIRLSSLVWLLLIAGAGGGLYHLKYKVIALEEDLANVQGDIDADRDAIAMLHAEWSYLNDPAQIEAYAAQHLGTRPGTVHDVVALSDIPMSSGHNPDRPQTRPDSTLPPTPPFAPDRRDTPDDATPPVAQDDSDDLLVAGTGTAPSRPDLSLVPAARAPSQPVAATSAPRDEIGALIANVLDARPQVGTDTDIGTIAVNFPRGVGQ